MPDIVLADFEMSQVEAESWDITGTPGYGSPEVLAVTRLRDIDPEAFRKARQARIMTTKSDMYQLGLLMYLMAAGKYWKTGADPKELQLPEEYQKDKIVGFMAALVWCLQPEPKQRPQSSRDGENGFLFAVEGFQKQRDAMFARDGPVLESMWNVSVTRNGDVLWR